MITARWLLMVVGGVVCLSLGWSIRDNRPSLEDRDRVQQREFEVNRARVWQDRYEEVARRPVDTVTITREVQRSDSIGLMILKTREALLLAKTQHDSLRYALRGWMQAEVRGQALQNALDESQMLWAAAKYWKEVADSAAPVIRGLQDALARETQARQCKTLGIIPGCMSRKTALIAGVGGGLILGLVLTRH